MWYKIINSGIKTRIKRSNMDCDITKEYINQLFENQKGRCALSGLEITLPKTWRDRKYTASLDRINSDIGYLKDNLVTCCWDCNRLKSDKYTYEEFIQFSPILNKIRRDRKKIS
jgi:hypothetical protein